MGDLDGAAFARRSAGAHGYSDTTLRRAVRSAELVRPVHGGYVIPSRSQVPAAFYESDVAHLALLRAQAAAAVLPPGVALADQTAALLHAGLWPPDAVPRAVFDRALVPARRTGLLARQARLTPADVADWHGLPVTTPLRTALDLSLRAPRADALVAVDALLRTGLVSTDDAAQRLEQLTRARGVLQARSIWAIADAGAASPGESRVRLALIDAKIGPIRTQVPLLGGLYIADLLVADRVIVEFEGTHHDYDRRQFAHDRQRFNALAAIPYGAVRRFTWRDVHQPGSIAAQVRAALRALDGCPLPDWTGMGRTA